MGFKYAWIAVAGVAVAGLESAALAQQTTPPSPPIMTMPVPPPSPPAQLQQPATPRGSPGNWITTNDYPSRALRDERQGIVVFVLDIGPDGRVSGCQITASSGSADLDAVTCSTITRRARFNPALDGSGEPTTGTYSSRVRWAIPEDEPEPLPQAGSAMLAFTLDRTGASSNCRITQSSGGLAALRPVGPASCQDFVYGRAFRDQRGRSVARDVKITMTVAIRPVPAVLPVVPAVESDLRGDMLAPPRTGTIVRTYVVEADGRQTNCQVEAVTGAATAQFRPGLTECLFNRFASVFLGSDGQPERRQVVETETVAYSTRR
jgi:TonB family protein